MSSQSRFLLTTLVHCPLLSISTVPFYLSILPQTLRYGLDLLCIQSYSLWIWELERLDCSRWFPHFLENRFFFHTIYKPHSLTSLHFLLSQIYSSPFFYLKKSEGLWGNSQKWQNKMPEVMAKALLSMLDQEMQMKEKQNVVLRYFVKVMTWKTEVKYDLCSWTIMHL